MSPPLRSDVEGAAVRLRLWLLRFELRCLERQIARPFDAEASRRMDVIIAALEGQAA